MSQTHEILDKLISYDTVSAKSNLGIIDYINDFLVSRNYAVTKVSDATGAKAGLYASIGPGSKPGIMLSAHTDVVPVEGQTWSRDPFRLTRDQGRLYGRGSTDMKGYLASMLALADKASKTKLNEPLKLAISYDEEIGCVGIQSMITDLEPAIGKPRACFVGEPTEMSVAVGHKGKAALKAVCHGEAGHSALAPKFTNAIHIAADFVNELRRIQNDLETNGARDMDYDIPYSTVHVGKLAAGTALNIVPERADLIFEFRHLPADDAKDIEKRIRDAAQKEIEIDLYNAYPGLDTDTHADVTKLAQATAQTTSTTKVAFGTEAGVFSEHGIPTIVCGPGSMEGQGHKADEFVTEDQLAKCDQMMDRLLVEISG